MAKAKEATPEAKVVGQIIITRYEDPMVAPKVSITGNWRPNHILACEGLIVKANRIKCAQERQASSEAANKENIIS